MSEKDLIGPSKGSEQTENISEIQENLKKIGFQDVSDDIIKKIGEYPDEKNGFLSDIDTLLRNPPPEENEKNRFETMYLKGFGQVVQLQDGSKKSFAEISGLPKEEKEKIINGMTRMEKIAFKEWGLQVANQRIETKKQVEQVANQTEKQLDTNIQVANQTEKQLDTNIQVTNQEANSAANRTDKEKKEGKKIDTELIAMNEKLGTQIEQLQKIDNVPKPDPEKLRQEALENPPIIQGKRLTKEDIESNKYDNIILASYYEKEETTISKKLTNSTDRLQFELAMKGIKNTLAGNPADQLDNITKSKVLGSARDEINARGEKIIESRTIRNITWDPNTREIIFQGVRDSYILETASQPPHERIIRGALSVSQEIPKLTKEEKQYKELQGEKKKGESELAGVAKDFKYADISEIPKGLEKSEAELADYKETKRKFVQAANPKEMLDDIHGFRLANEKLEKVNRESIPLEADTGLHEKMGNELEREHLSILGLEKSLEKVIALETQEKDSKGSKNENQSDQFAINARYNIDLLSQLGIDKSFKNMDEISGFIETQGGVDSSSDWGDSESINTYLGREKLGKNQLEKLLSGLVRVHDTIRQDQVSELADNKTKINTLNSDEGDGRIKLQASLDTYRNKKGGGFLTRSDFVRILGEKK